jgi:gas vesicle protein
MFARVKAFVVGVGVGIFVAPLAGRETRQLVLEKISELFELGGQQIDDLESELDERRTEQYPATEPDIEPETEPLVDEKPA